MISPSKVLAALERSGKPVSIFAAEHGLDAQRVYIWRRRLGASAESTPFQELLVRPSLRAPFEITLGSGTTLRVPSSFDAYALSRLLDVLWSGVDSGPPSTPRAPCRLGRSRPRSLRSSSRASSWPALNEGASVASDVTAVDVLLIEHEEHAILAQEVRNALIAETEAGLTLLILDALRAGIEGQSALSAHLKCPIPDIRSAYKRIKRRLLALREKKGGPR